MKNKAKALKLIETIMGKLVHLGGVLGSDSGTYIQTITRELSRLRSELERRKK